MNLSTLPTIIKKKKKRLGQGHGSGRVKTSGRGTKGQKARHTIKLSFEGGALPLIKRIPFLRGKGRNYSFQNKPVTINIHRLHGFSQNAVVDIQTLTAQGLVKGNDAKKYGIKILGDGELKTALTIKVPISKKAKEKVEKAGGRVEFV